MACFRQLDFSERQCIAVLYLQKCSMAEIARRLGRARSTIKRELERNGVRDKEGRLHYDPVRAGKKYVQRKAKAGYGKGFRLYGGGKARGHIPWLTGMPNPNRKDKEQGYRYRPFLKFQFRADRIPTVDKDWRRFFREAEFREDRKKYFYLKKGWPTPCWLLPERKKRKHYIPRYYGFQWLEQRPDEKPRKGRRWSMYWLCRRRKEDARKYRKKRAPFYSWPGGMRQVFIGTIRLPERKKSLRCIPFSNTIQQKPKNFRMESVCPKGKNFMSFSKNETSPGVDKSVLFLNPGIFSPTFYFSV